MSTPDLNKCACCDSRLAPTLADTANSPNRMSFGVWAMCPGCEMAGPKTWLAFEELTDAEMASAQAEAARAWNQIHAAVSNADAVITIATGSGRAPSLRGRAS